MSIDMDSPDRTKKDDRDINVIDRSGRSDWSVMSVDGNATQRITGNESVKVLEKEGVLSHRH
jgi:hypothetical protein